ncbi:MAG: hypothetical protein HOJ41_04940 [Rhodospirillaceae bacterium]|nr:hypothetical protein [Rhodospirillaceae bacterium]
MKRFLDFNWVPRSAWLDRVMASSPLIVCDISANGGLEERWKRLKQFCFFILFEPRVDGVPKPGSSSVQDSALVFETGIAILHNGISPGFLFISAKRPRRQPS